MTPGTANLTRITMVLSPFSSSGDTRLIRFRDTLYKLKILLADDPTKQLAKELQDSFHTEVEEVVRAVVFMVENNSSLVKIQTDHFLVVPSLPLWKLGQELVFRQDGKELNACLRAIILTLTCNGGERVEASASGMTHSLPQENHREERGARNHVGSLHGEVVERGNESFHQINETMPAAFVASDRSVDTNASFSGIPSDAPPNASGTTVSHTSSAAWAGKTTANHITTTAATSETVVNHTFPTASSHAPSVTSETVQNSSEAVPAASEPSSSHQKVIDRGKDSKGKISVESSRQRSPSKTSTSLAVQSRSLRSVKDMSGGLYNLRKSVQHSYQSPKGPLKTRSRDSSSSTSTRRQKRNVRAIHSDSVHGYHTDGVQAGKETSRAGRRIKEHVEQVSSRAKHAADTFTQSASPGIGRTRRQMTSHSGATISRYKNNPRGLTSAVPTSNHFTSRSHSAQHKYQQPAHKPPARSRPRKIIKTYALRHSINRSAVMEEQRLNDLASHQTLSIQSQGRPIPTRSAVKTFEQKDRHMVETGDIQEELKLQNLASSDGVHSDGKSGPQGSKRNISLGQTFSDTVVAPIKRALRSYTE